MSTIPDTNIVIKNNSETTDPRFNAYVDKNYPVPQDSTNLKHPLQLGPDDLIPEREVSYDGGETFSKVQLSQKKTDKRSLAAALAASRIPDSVANIDSVAARSILDPEKRKYFTTIAARKGKANLVRAGFHVKDYADDALKKHPLVKTFVALGSNNDQKASKAEQISTELAGKETSERVEEICVQALARMNPDQVSHKHGKFITEYAPVLLESNIGAFNTMKGIFHQTDTTGAAQIAAFINLIEAMPVAKQKELFPEEECAAQIKDFIEKHMQGGPSTLMLEPQRLLSRLSKAPISILSKVLDHPRPNENFLYKLAAKDPSTALTIMSRLHEEGDDGLDLFANFEGRKLVETSLLQGDEQLQEKTLDSLLKYLNIKGKARLLSLMSPEAIKAYLLKLSETTKNTKLIDKFTDLFSAVTGDYIGDLSLSTSPADSSLLTDIFSKPEIHPRIKSKIFKNLAADSFQRKFQLVAGFYEKGAGASNILEKTLSITKVKDEWEMDNNALLRELIDCFKIKSPEQQVGMVHKWMLDNPEKSSNILTAAINNSATTNSVIETIENLVFAAESHKYAGNDLIRAIPVRESLEYLINNGHYLSKVIGLINSISSLPDIQAAELERQGFYDVVLESVSKALGSDGHDLEYLNILLDNDKIDWTYLFQSTNFALTEDDVTILTGKEGLLEKFLKFGVSEFSQS